MRRILLLLFLLMMPFALGSSMDAKITINSNDIVRQDFTITTYADKSYDSFTFVTLEKPVSVIYDGDYSVQDTGNGYEIKFMKGLVQGDNTLSFTIISDNLVETSGSHHSFRTAFSRYDSSVIRLTLPEGYTLSDEPSASPTPSRMTTDGKHIMLSWSFSDTEPVVAVFYEGGNQGTLYFALVIIIMMTSAIFLYFRSRSRKAVTEILTPDEREVLDLIREGKNKQSDIARTLNFSKSKMSKVIRKLEEKKLIEKEPYFKTNKLKAKI